jgi:hypothetical protein
LDGSTCSNRPQALEQVGPWDEEAYQLWIVRIPDSACATHDGERCKCWQWSLWELYDKPHRAICDGVDHGEILARTDLRDIAHVRHVERLGLIRYEDQRDARALRLWLQRRLRVEKTACAVRRRRRAYRDAETRRGRAYKGIGRKYYRYRTTKGL